MRTRRKRKPFRQEAKAKYVYVISRSRRLAKIGVSKSPKRRLATLQSATPDTLTLFHFERPSALSAYEVEGAVLALLERWRVGGEWFCCDPWLARLVIRLVQNQPQRQIVAFLDLLWKSDVAEREWERTARKPADHKAAWQAYRATTSLLAERFSDWYGQTSEYLGWKITQATKAALRSTGSGLSVQ